MFINQNHQTSPSNQPSGNIWTGFFKHHPGLKMVIISLIALLLLAGIIVFMVLNNRTKTVVPKPQPAKEVLPTLPSAKKTELNRLLGEDSLESFKAEELLFGFFYKQPSSKLAINNPGIKLPFNVKTDTANYYSLTRQIDLDEAIEDLNNNGVAVIDNPFIKEADNFYAVYQELKAKNIPFLVTNDFLIYYYQNSLKDIFKYIEAEVFYRDFWDINKKLFEIADKRYKERYGRLGILNDPLLEAQRLEVAYFATMLELLKPKAKQILPATDKDYVDETKFTELEAKYYSFELPDYLKIDVQQELELINQAKKFVGQPKKSPTLLYWRDYGKFIIPKQYSDNDKLYNFYLANVWANSLFPLYFRGDDCSDCLLDKDDWQINFIAANFIANDFKDNQKIKNRWAKIYKVISYFNGLRSGLTYLQYSNSVDKVFGPKAVISDLFAGSNPERQSNLVKLQSEIISYNFDPAQGAYNLLDQKKLHGLRLLREKYWPNEYIYNQLTFTKIGQHNNYNKKKKNPELSSLCVATGQKTNRCRGTGFDIVNIIFDEDLSPHFYDQRNSDYQFYANELAKVKNHFIKFNKLNWHSSNFWSTLSIDKELLSSRKIGAFPYTQSDAWTKINLDTAVSSMLNMQQPIDKWNLSFRRDDGLQSSDNIVKYNFIEPNINLINELLANARMVFKTLYSLELIQINDSKFNRLLTDLIRLKKLVGKELADEEFNFDDWQFINDFVGQYYIVKEANKLTRLNFINPDTGKKYSLTQSLNGVKLLVSIYFHQNKKVIVVGPIFNYQEKKR